MTLSKVEVGDMGVIWVITWYPLRQKENHQQGDEYLVKFRKVSSDNEDGEGHIK